MWQCYLLSKTLVLARTLSFTLFFLSLSDCLIFQSIEMDCKQMMPKTCSNYHRRRHRDHHHSNVFLKIVFVSCARDASKIFMWMSIKPRCKPIFFHSRMRDYLMCVRCRVVPVCYCVLFFRKRRKNHLFLYVKYERKKKKAEECGHQNQTINAKDERLLSS